MKKYRPFLVLIWLLLVSTLVFAAPKHRVIVLTDIENEPDDAMSLVRFLTYANQWDVEALIASTSVHQKNKIAPWRIREIVEAYGKVRDNLELHEKGFPQSAELLSVIKDGLALYGMNGVGEGRDSTGSEAIIKALDKEDSRPVWIIVWGGPNVLAQALWKMQATRSDDEVQKLIAKLRVYTISDQDDSGPWIRRNFPNLFYIASPGFHPLGGYHHSTWTGISGDKFHGRFTGADFSIVDNHWLDKNIRSKGALGAEYPQTKFIMEGDSPSFLYLVDNGLGNSEKPHWGSWGGRYEFYTPPWKRWHLAAETRPFWNDAEDEVLGSDGQWHTSNKATIWRWRAAYQNDFSARMDWTIKSFAEANHPPVIITNQPQYIDAKPGEIVKLSAVGSTDPDHDTLSYQWFYYAEAGTFVISSGRTGNPLVIENSNQQNALLTIPENFGRAGTIHIILAVTDSGKPPLTRYRRIIINVVQ